jgi:hypothetical protein
MPALGQLGYDFRDAVVAAGEAIVVLVLISSIATKEVCHLLLGIRELPQLLDERSSNPLYPLLRRRCS